MERNRLMTWIVKFHAADSVRKRCAKLAKDQDYMPEMMIDLR